MKLSTLCFVLFFCHLSFGQDTYRYKNTYFIYKDSTVTFKNDTLHGGLYFSKHNVDSINLVTRHNKYTYYFKNYVLDKICATYHDSLTVELKLSDDKLQTAFFVNNIELKKEQIVFTNDTNMQTLLYDNLVNLKSISYSNNLAGFWLDMPGDVEDLYFEKTLYYGYYYLSYLSIPNTTIPAKLTSFVGLKQNRAYRGYSIEIHVKNKLKDLAYYSFLDENFTLVKTRALGRDRLLVKYAAN